MRVSVGYAWVVVSITAAGFVLGSCKQEASESSCGDGPGCEPGYGCVVGECRQLCTAQAPCPDDEVCVVEGYCRMVSEQEPPEIQTIQSDGPADGISPYGEYRIGNELIITGLYLGQATAALEAINAGTTSFPELTNLSAGDHELIVALPPALEDETGSLSYTLVVTNPGGSARAELLLERGEDATGISGAEIIDLLNTARAGGATLLADELGNFDEAAIASLEARLIAAEAAAATLNENVTATGYEAQWACPGALRRGVCVVEYDNTNDVPWGVAVDACTSLGADLCTTAQYAVLREGGAWGIENSTLFYDNRAVWSADFSDNDGESGNFKDRWLNSVADPQTADTYGYACCYNATAEPFRRRVQVWSPDGYDTGKGVWTTYLHPHLDTTFPTAANICAKLSSDLCTKSQYVTLHDNGLFGDSPMQVWTNEQSDNDNIEFNDVIGPAIAPVEADNRGWSRRLAYACCGNQRPLDDSCPGSRIGDNMCVLDIHGTNDSNFFEAARACASLGADICSKSQMQVLRNSTFPASAWSWTNDGGDNDSSRAGGLNSAQPDDPNPTTDSMGYACCY